MSESGSVPRTVTFTVDKYTQSAAPGTAPLSVDLHCIFLQFFFIMITACTHKNSSHVNLLHSVSLVLVSPWLHGKVCRKEQR